MKRRSILKDDSSAAVKKRRVDYGTFQKWRKDLDRECLTVSWLDCTSEKVNSKTVVSKLLTQTQVLIFGGQLKTDDRIKGKESNIRLVNLNI